jgi:hypothetical protein
MNVSRCTAQTNKQSFAHKLPNVPPSSESGAVAYLHVLHLHLRVAAYLDVSHSDVVQNRLEECLRACAISARLSPLPLLRRDWAYPCHICTGTGLAPTTSAPELGSPRPHLRRNWARPCHVCVGTGLAPTTSAPELGSPRPRLRQDRARPGDRAHRSEVRGRRCPNYLTVGLYPVAGTAWHAHAAPPDAGGYSGGG